jgi:signal transduction histidine kinase
VELIFTPFKRLVKRSVYEGSGLGLPICRKIVERHGGSLTATSTPGQGSTFCLVLPLRQRRTPRTRAGVEPEAEVV